MRLFALFSLQRTLSAPETKYCLPSSLEKDEDEVEANKERHSSGDSADSALSASPTPPVESIDTNDTNKAPESPSRFVVTPADLVDVVCPVKRGILKRRTERGRCFSESQADHMRLMGTSSSCVSVDSSIPEDEDITDGKMHHSSGDSTGSKKSVRFSEVVQRQVFRSNSSILGQKHKNMKKNEQKRRRAAERRASDSDAAHVMATDPAIAGAGFKIAPAPSESSIDEFHNDSGVASSIEESFVKEKETEMLNKSKAKRQARRKAALANKGRFLKEANPDLIFDLDI